MNSKFYSCIIVCLFSVTPSTLFAQENTISADKDWYAQQSILRMNDEADAIIRIGDVDHFGFNWTQQADPFCASSYFAHTGLFKANTSEVSGFDRAIFSSKYNPSETHSCGKDSYVRFYEAEKKVSGNFSLPTSSLKGLVIKDAYLQMFVDGFQAPTYCSKFQLLLNDNSFPEGDYLLNSIDQDGMAGKLITIPISQEFYEALSSGNPLRISLNELNGSADGFIIDFIRLIVNKKNNNLRCTAGLKGLVVDLSNEQPISGAKVSLPDNTNVLTNSKGEFVFTDVPVGCINLNVSARGYADASSIAENVTLKNEFQDITIGLEPGKKGLQYFGKSVTVGETISLDNLFFKEGSNVVIEGKVEEELVKIISFLTQYKNTEIELIGSTAAENNEYSNRSLAFKKVKMCKDYMVRKGIDTNRIKAIGYARKKSNLPSNTDPGSLNKTRIEMRFKKI